MDRHAQPPACGALAEALLQSGRQIALVVGHMAEFSAGGRAAAESPGFRAVLRDIAADVFEHSLADLGEDELRVAARVVTRATEAIADALVLVPPDAELNRPRTPAPRHRRRPL